MAKLTTVLFQVLFSLYRLDVSVAKVEDVDLTVITWAHAVNSISKLDQALTDDTAMLEADISMGFVVGQPIGQPAPIMAHPPAILSDLSFETFLEQVIERNGNLTTKKGIKLDFKNINALEPCLQVIQSIQTNDPQAIDFPIWLNADILYGPMNSTGVPVDAISFLNLTASYFPNAMLSPGWTTRYGGSTNITGGRYEQSHLDEMTKVLKDNIELIVPPTFPLRAGIAAETPIEDLENFLDAQQLPGATLTIWSSDADFVDTEKLKKMVNTIGRNRIYLDLPFTLNLDK